MLTESESKTIERGCDHGGLWLARDGSWYCEACEPPHFECEVVERRQVAEALRLFDLEERGRQYAA